MCGRYVRRSDKQRLAEHFHAKPHPAVLPLPKTNYNVAPTTPSAHHLGNFTFSPLSH